MSINKVILVGYVGANPIIRQTRDGKKIANFSLATTLNYTKDKETKSKTEWHKIVIYPPSLIEIVEKFVTKGTRLYIEGTIQTRSWVDEKTGDKRSSTEVALLGYNSHLLMLEKGEFQNNNFEYQNKKANGYVSDSYDERNDEIPF